MKQKPKLKLKWYGTDLWAVDSKGRDVGILSTSWWWKKLLAGRRIPPLPKTAKRRKL